MLAAAGELTAANVFALWFPGDPPEDAAAALEAINRFYRRKDEPPETSSDGAPGPIPYDFTVDAGAIHADFMREYGVDLTVAEMHWWRFMALLEGLITPTFSRRVEVRTKDLSGMKSKERAAWMKMRSIYAIEETETFEDHIAQLDAIIARGGGHSSG